MRAPDLRFSRAGGLGAFAVVTALSLAVFGWPAPPSSAAADNPRRGTAEVFDPAFALTPDAYEDEMSRPRPALPGTVDGGRGVIGNCNAYLVAHRSWDRRNAVTRDPDFVHYRNCLPLHLVHTGRAPTWHLARGDRLGQALLERLDPQRTGAAAPPWFASAGRLADVAGERAVAAHGVVLRHGDETWSIEAVASLDLLDSGSENLLARVTWRGQVTYVVVRPRPSGDLVAVPADVFGVPLGVAPL
ncbi:hypothetical protein [Azospirillum sp. ST 5-10]|uniref:hypothetical protein n=1 Tax=unclassified Azospirillum TaxID=2630922 RepID=UPI003F49EEB2